MNLLDVPREWQLSDPTRWYVVFCSAKEYHWWDYIFRTRAGFSHVYALRWDGFNWIAFNPSVEFTDIVILPGTSERALYDHIPKGATIVEVEAFRRCNRIRGRWWVGPMTCVEQIKALLGLSVGYVWTPWQLYQHLIRECENG